MLSVHGGIHIHSEILLGSLSFLFTFYCLLAAWFGATPSWARMHPGLSLLNLLGFAGVMPFKVHTPRDLLSPPVCPRPFRRRCRRTVVRLGAYPLPVELRSLIRQALRLLDRYCYLPGGLLTWMRRTTTCSTRSSPLLILKQLLCRELFLIVQVRAPRTPDVPVGDENRVGQDVNLLLAPVQCVDGRVHLLPGGGSHPQLGGRR